MATKKKDQKTEAIKPVTRWILLDKQGNHDDLVATDYGHAVKQASRLLSERGLGFPVDVIAFREVTP